MSGGFFFFLTHQGEHCQTEKEYVKLQVVRKLPHLSTKPEVDLREKKVFMISHCTLILLTSRPSYSLEAFIANCGRCRFRSACASFHDTSFSSKTVVDCLWSSFFSIQRCLKPPASFHNSVFCLFELSHVTCSMIYYSSIEETRSLVEIWGGNAVWKIQRFPVQITQASLELPRAIMCRR